MGLIIVCFRSHAENLKRNGSAGYPDCGIDHRLWSAKVIDRSAIWAQSLDPHRGLGDLRCPPVSSSSPLDWKRDLRHQPFLVHSVVCIYGATDAVELLSLAGVAGALRAGLVAWMCTVAAGSNCRAKTPAPIAIMVARDPRGDMLSLLCRLLGLRVVRGDREQGGWEALADLAGEIERGACAIITADGGGPAREAKPGAVALASATGVPLLALGADCHPALSMPHKWDAPRNPIPFSRLAVTISESYHCPFSLDLSSIEHSRCRLQSMLNETSAATSFQDDH